MFSVLTEPFLRNADMEANGMNSRSENGSPTTFVLVIGATGTQGGAVARDLLGHGHRVRILTRNPATAAARILVKAGAEVVCGDMGDPASLDTAMHGVSGVFSVQPGDASGGDAEQRYASALIEAALKAGVRHFVHTSVAGIDRSPRQGVPLSLLKYWDKKWNIEEHVRNAGLALWTIFRPTWVMENLAEPASLFMFPKLKEGEMFTALQAATRLDMISADDIGAFVRAAFENPAQFKDQNIALAAESLTMGEVAATLSKVLGKNVRAVALSPAEAVARGLHPNVVNSQAYRNEVGFQVKIEELKRYGIPLTTFEEWVYKHRDTIVIR